MRVAIGSDHAGFQLKEEIKRFLHNSHVDCGDFGVSSTEPADYPDIAEMVAEAVAQGKFDCGILVCGTGIGMAIAANKVPGIRAALCHDLFTARAAKEHNDANILALGGRVLNPQLACEIVETWLNAHFAGERHARRLEKIRSLEARYCCNGEEKQEVG